MPAEMSVGTKHGTVYDMILNGCVKTIRISCIALILIFNSPSSTTRTWPGLEPPLTCKRQDTMPTTEGK
jgi:hypothetical protein